MSCRWCERSINMPLYKSETNSPKRGPSDKSQIQTKFQHSISRFIISRFTPLLSGYTENIFIDSLRLCASLRALRLGYYYFNTKSIKKTLPKGCLRQKLMKNKNTYLNFFILFILMVPLCSKNEYLVASINFPIPNSQFQITKYVQYLLSRFPLHFKLCLLYLHHIFPLRSLWTLYCDIIFILNHSDDLY